MRDLGLNFNVKKINRGRVKKSCCECDKIVNIGQPAYSVSYVSNMKAINLDLCSEKCLKVFINPLKEKIKSKVSINI
jgi:hypothetical protein